MYDVLQVAPVPAGSPRLIHTVPTPAPNRVIGCEVLIPEGELAGGFLSPNQAVG